MVPSYQVLFDSDEKLIKIQEELELAQVSYHVL